MSTLFDNSPLVPEAVLRRLYDAAKRLEEARIVRDEAGRLFRVFDVLVNAMADRRRSKGERAGESGREG